MEADLESDERGIDDTTAISHQRSRLFDLPFPSRMNPERVRTAVHSRAWAQRMGLAADPETLRIHHDRYDFSSWSARAFCDAVGADLDLGSDLAAWFGYFEDFFDSPAVNDAERVHQFVSSVIAVVDGAGPALPAHPVVAALADLWSRQRRGMSDIWQARAAANWRDYLSVHIAEAAYRRNQTVPAVDAYLALRDITGVVWVILDFAESIGHYEISAGILELSAIQAMRRITVRVSGVIQDVLSLAREEKMGDPNNLVLALERYDGMSRAEAIDYIHRMLRVQTDTFLAEEAGIPRVLDQFDVPAEERTDVYKYIADMRAIMRATLDFCLASKRYVLPG
jgi:pentalenene synthase